MTDMIRMAWSEDFRHFRSFRGTKCYPQKDDDGPTEMGFCYSLYKNKTTRTFEHRSCYGKRP